MAEKEPVVLELAALPREQIGPFLLLGVDKAADREQTEANWARRLIWARKNQIRVPLEDVNWAKEQLADPERHARLSAASLNLDTADGVLARLQKRYGDSAAGRPRWQPLDEEKSLRDYVPPGETPDVEEIRATLRLPEIPDEYPGARLVLDALAGPLPEPWAVTDIDEPTR